MTQPRTPLKPYKFLDHYLFEDRDIFFGRERESEILLSDVIATRLVVLFARTGSGKSSLINAGVRPRLEDLDYSTFYIRVEKDPIASMRKTLKESNVPALEEELPLVAQLESLVERLQKPIVLFFDQFEEFFVYAVQDQPELSQQFVSDVAHVYRNRNSGVHMVFSMREEFFVEMDIFRDEIPSIFHSDSNLRLRWFDTTQARDAILLPARRFDTLVDDNLVEQIIQDLQQRGRVEPAKLQIVCDTLWQHRSGTSLTLAVYQQLGGAERILDRRLMQDITVGFDDEVLYLLKRLLPELITDRGTKYVRGFDELTQKLQWDPELLQKLIDQLSSLGLIRSFTHSGTRFFEWTSDYIAERSALLEQRVRTVLLIRKLQAAMEEAKILAENLKSSHTVQLTYKQHDVLYLSADDFESLSADAQYTLELDREQLEFLFLAALEHGDHMQLWFRQASARDVPVWDILDKLITDKSVRLEQAENAVRLLGELKSAQALEMLNAALKNETLSSLAVEMLGRIETPEAFQLLENALKQDALAPQVLSVLAQSDTLQVVELLQAALQRNTFARQAEQELDRLSRSRNPSVADHATQVLQHGKTARQDQPAQNSDVARQSLEEPEWELLLRRIRSGKCIPIVGPQALAGILPSQAEIAEEWAGQFGYPAADVDNLARVASYLAVEQDDMYPKELLIKRWYSNPRLLDDAKVEDPHRALARLPLSIYLTTNYDPFMTQALISAGKLPHRELCKWNRFIKDVPSIFDQNHNFQPSPAEPIVFHLYGHDEYAESLVLTENDYLDFLLSISREDGLLPVQVRAALAGNSLLFLGYDFMDWGFQVFFRSLISSMEQNLRRISIFVQDKTANQEVSPEMQRYAEKYSRNYDLRVYRGTAQEFTQELTGRWEAYSQES